MTAFYYIIYWKLLLVKSIQEHLCQLHQTVSPSKMLAIPLCLDALFGHFKQGANKQNPRCQTKSYIAPPKLITKAMDGLFKYTMHNKFSNFLCFASSLCSSLCSADLFQLQWRKQDLRQTEPRNFRRHPFNRHLGRARGAEGASKQKSHPL